MSGNFGIQAKVREKSGNFEIPSLYMIKSSKIKAKPVSSCLAIIIIIMINKILLLLIIIIKILIIIVIQWTLFTKATFVPKYFDFELNLLL